jgi:hypothetical protein
VVAHESEVLEHGVVGRKADLAGDVHGVRLGRQALERHAGVFGDDLDAVEPAEEVEVPEGAAELAVGYGVQPDLLLAADRMEDRLVFDVPQCGGVDLAVLEAGTGLMNGCGAQQAADLVGAEWGAWSCTSV